MSTDAWETIVFLTILLDFAAGAWWMWRRHKIYWVIALPPFLWHVNLLAFLAYANLFPHTSDVTLTLNTWAFLILLHANLTIFFIFIFMGALGGRKNHGG